MILAGGDCEIGLESTIVKLDGDHLTLLRPGAITPEMLQEVFPSVTVDDCSQRPIGENEKPAAPGMKYRHYAPRAKVIVLDGEPEDVLSYQKQAAKKENTGILCREEHFDIINGKHVFSIGKDPGDRFAEFIRVAFAVFFMSAVDKCLYRLRIERVQIGFAVVPA